MVWCLYDTTWIVCCCCLFNWDVWLKRIWRLRSAPTTDRHLIEVIIMNNYLLIEHGFNNHQIDKIVRQMAELKDAKLGYYSETEIRARLHYTIEQMTDHAFARIENIGDLFLIYSKMRIKIRPKYLQNRAKKGKKSNINDSKQMMMDLDGVQK